MEGTRAKPGNHLVSIVKYTNDLEERVSSEILIFADDKKLFRKNYGKWGLNNNCMMTLINCSSGPKNCRCYSILRNVYKHGMEILG